MESAILVFVAALFAADPAAPASAADGAANDVDEPSSGAGVAPVELIPRLELRQSFVELHNGASAHTTTAEIDIGFLSRLLLRYQGPLRVVSGPNGQISGFGDAQIQLVGLLAWNRRFVVAAIAGAILDTASQPQLGEGKQQLVLGGAAAAKPFPWWLPYLIVQQQVSVAGDDARPDVNQLLARVGNIVFGKGYSWYKLDFDGLVDFAADRGRLYGTFEVGSLLIGRTGLFMRGGTQLLGAREVDYSLEVGVRYLFRLGTGK
jgi:hypothetical protein